MTTINTKEKELLNRIMEHPLFETLVGEEDLKQVEILRGKINKKKIDKKAVIADFSVEDLSGQRFTFRMGKDNGSLLIIANKATFQKQDRYAFKWDTSILAKLIRQFHGIHEFWGETLQFPYHKPYSEEFNVYENEVERSISLSRSGISFECYTGDQEDDNWTRIRPARMRMFLKMMNAYLFLAEDVEEGLQQVPEAIRNLYPEWKKRLEEEELEIG